MDEQTQETTNELPPRDQRDFVVAEDLAPAPQRPEWLPEKFKTPEDLSKAYSELSSKLGAKEEDLRNKFMEEMRAEAFKDRPESAGDYQLPDFIDAESSVDNDLLQWWSEHSFESGLGQAEFERGLQMYYDAISKDQPDYDAEIKKLGDNANARIEAATLFANQFFPEEHLSSIERLAETADGLMALEFIMEKMRTPSVNSPSTSASRITEESLREMMQDERYWHPARRNQDFIKEVNSGFQKLYNGRA